MHCPACSRTLRELEIAGFTVDVCDGGCGGIWFDQFEVARFDEPHESEGESLIDVARDPSLTVDHSRRHNCPKCSDSVMARHFWSARKQVEIDECYVCGGFWLDCGELGSIRRLFNSDDERRAAAREYFRETIGPELARMRAESKEKHRIAKKIAWFFRFICPSYYIPGKQDWGAF